MGKKTFFLVLIAVCLIGCKSTSPVINSPYSVGIDLSKQKKTSFTKYTEIIGDKPPFSAIDYKSKAVMKKYMNDRVIAPLQAVDGLTVEELINDYDTEMAKITICTDDLFKTMTPHLTESGSELLRPIAKVLNNNGLTLAIINCHCEQSTYKLRTSLTQSRAECIAEALVGMGVQKERIIDAMGCGDESPVASNDTSEGKKKNRRAEIYICASKALYEKILNQEIDLVNGRLRIE